MTMRKLAACLAAIGTCAAAVYGQNVGVTAKVGTLGVGGDLTVGLGSELNLRGGYNWFSYDRTVSLNEADLDGTLDMNTIPVLLDWHCFGGGFRISGGVVVNNNEISLSATPGTVLELDRRGFRVESVDGSVTFDELAPYAGIGYGNAIGKDGSWHFFCDFGVLFQGEPEVQATAKASNPGVQGALNRALQVEIDDYQKDIEDYAYWPVIAIGLSYRF
jgi:hypothetical protein